MFLTGGCACRGPHSPHTTYPRISVVEQAVPTCNQTSVNCPVELTPPRACLWRPLEVCRRSTGARGVLIAYSGWWWHQQALRRAVPGREQRE